MESERVYIALEIKRGLIHQHQKRIMSEKRGKRRKVELKIKRCNQCDKPAFYIQN